VPASNPAAPASVTEAQPDSGGRKSRHRRRAMGSFTFLSPSKNITAASAPGR
jgi:hypothetical protein